MGPSSPKSKQVTHTRGWIVLFIQSLPIALLFGAFYLRDVNVARYNRLLAEDGPVEYLQVFLFVVAAVCFLRIALLERGAARALAFCLMAGAFFLACEEISWGQRIFGIQTPPQLVAINTQREITLHNIQGVFSTFRILTWCAATYGLLVPYVISSRRSTIARLLVTSHDFCVFYGAIVWYFIYTRIVHDSNSECLRVWQIGQKACLIAWNEQEWMELLVAAVLVLHAADVWLWMLRRRRMVLAATSIPHS